MQPCVWLEYAITGSLAYFDAPQSIQGYVHPQACQIPALRLCDRVALEMRSQRLRQRVNVYNPLLDSGSEETSWLILDVQGNLNHRRNMVVRFELRRRRVMALN